MLYEQEPKSGVEKAPEEAMEDSYSFMKETIKSGRKKHLMQAAKMAVGGLLFGIFACCGFFALKPWVEDTFYEETPSVNIPEDAEIEETASQDIEATQSKETILTAESYEEIMESMYDIVEEADKSLAIISTVEENEGAEGISISGVIVADNGEELMILAEDDICDESAAWTVTFDDKKEYNISLKTRDKSRGIAVFSVDRASLSSETKKAVEVCELGNSNFVSRGDVIIALGNMFGYEGGFDYGIVSSVEHEVTFADGTCRVIATDIETVSKGTGILFNQSGQMIGLIKRDIWQEAESKTANAYAVSDLKAVLELMLNGKSVPYFGIYGTTVTEEIAEEQKLPEGVYVTSVEGDSPAMQAGIQVGDVIQEVDGTDIMSMNSYKKTILQCEEGEEIKVKAKRRGAEGFVDVSFTVMTGSKK
ncbi:MAG: serine protease [Ruminococcus sp.]|nr:serine protease [Ruminococcus sp.]